MEKKVIKRSLIAILADSSGSDSTNESDMSELSDMEELLKFHKEPARKRSCIKKYFEEVVPTYNEKEFRTHFRISKELFNSLSMRFEVCPEFSNLREDKRISPIKHMSVFLWFAAHEACSYRDLADRFDLSLWAVENVINRVITFISGLADEVIKWPDETKKQEISRNFQQNKGFRGVIGPIDGTHIVIDPPRKGKDDYIDREGNCSVCLQGICDNNAKFIDVCIGFPGSVHDCRVLQNSPVFPNLETLCGEGHLLGDSAYICLNFLLTPYRDNGHLTTGQKDYNKVLSSCRVVVEHAFGMLKQRFRQLYYCKLKGMKKLCHFIRACCVLHNLADQDDVEGMEHPNDFRTSRTETSAGCSNNYNDTSLGKAKRDQICEELRLNKHKHCYRFNFF